VRRRADRAAAPRAPPWVARAASQVGGSRSDSFTASFRQEHITRRTSAGRPSAPVTASVPRQLLLMMSSVGSLEMGCTPLAQGSLPATDAPQHLRRGARLRSRSAGSVTCNSSSSRSPVTGFSRRVSSCSRIRKGLGAMPVAIPECTPSVSTRTRSVPTRLPAQRRRAPHLLVVAAFGIQAYHEGGLAHGIAERCQIAPADRNCRFPRTPRSGPPQRGRGTFCAFRAAIAVRS